MESKGNDLGLIYKLRHDFTIIALTGNTASGCSEVADQLVKGFDEGKDFSNPTQIFKESGNTFSHNAYRKLRIVYDYARENFESYIRIKYKDILTVLLLNRTLDELISFLESDELKKEFNKSGLRVFDFANQIASLSRLREDFNKLSASLKNIGIIHSEEERQSLLYEFFFDQSFQVFSQNLHDCLGKDADLREHKVANASISYHKTMQVISNNLRRCSNPFNFKQDDPASIFTIARTINELIKCLQSRSKSTRTQVVINSLKNPLEIMFFKHQYASFYSIAVYKDPDAWKNAIWPKFTMTDDKTVVQKLLKEEHDGGKGSDFFKQNISACLQSADIHISFISRLEAKQKNEDLENKKGNLVDNTSPFFSWNDQILKFVSLIDHPGLITPSPEERCMQLAYTAKHNSGCISRHVGAAVTDEHYSIKAVGWNNTPEGQVPCSLRKTDDLLQLNQNSDTAAFTPFEFYNTEFQSVLKEHFVKPIEENREKLKGRNVCFCFKSLRNSYSEGKNQVHTRSLHAEESAFLQISKNGGVGIRNGKLFSTASPCELCAKKAYQLGIKVIYYIDPYPGISMEHILKAGSSQIEVRLFAGAIGNAYHWLYEPVIPYKDEMTLILGHEIKDLTAKLTKKNDDLQIENITLRERIKELESKH